jgi:hypothetical protein
MKWGIVMPHGDARQAADTAKLAEDHGWDGFFVWEPVWGIDAWVCLTAAAMLTRTIRLGTMLTPISRMRPWDLAGKAATLDHLSNGRVNLAIGLGAPDTGWANFNEVTDRKTRAELMDEGLIILTALWTGQPFTHQGKHYQVTTENAFMPPPPPVQKPRIPVWVVGAWPSEKSMQRVCRYDGLLPMKLKPAGAGSGERVELVTPDDLREMHVYVGQNRALTTPFDIIVEGQTPGDDPAKDAATLRGWQAAGATWWIESLWEAKDLPAIHQRIRRGPIRV